MKNACMKNFMKMHATRDAHSVSLCPQKGYASEQLTHSFPSPAHSRAISQLVCEYIALIIVDPTARSTSPSSNHY
jgi:hypothetical protein